MNIEKFINEAYVAKVFSTLSAVSAETGAEAYLVGGAVRDLLLGKEPNDLDFVVFGHPYEGFAKLVASRLGRRAVSFKQNMRVPYKDSYFDISEPRGATLTEDLALRDFTINNLALSLNGEVIGNPDDLKKGLIRPVHDRSLDDDPLRILRGFRQAASLGFGLTEEFLSAAEAKTALLSTVAAERKGTELRKLADTPNEKIYNAMKYLGVWQEVFGFSPDVSLLMNAAKAAANFPSEKAFALFLAVLGRQAFVNVSGRLALSAAEIKYATLLLNTQLSTDTITESVWRYKDNLDYVLTFLSITGAEPALLDAHKKCFAELDFSAAEAVSGDDILRLAEGRKAGKWVAELLMDTKIKLASGDLKNREEALEYMRMATK
jgi:tRNA nucleotidyltransferase/poly(A) polymerase